MYEQSQEGNPGAKVIGLALQFLSPLIESKLKQHYYGGTYMEKRDFVVGRGPILEGE